MKVIIEEIANPSSPYFNVYVKGATMDYQRVFSYKYAEDPVSIWNREKNYDQALAYAKSLEEFLTSGLPLKKIVYENELPEKEN